MALAVIPVATGVASFIAVVDASASVGPTGAPSIGGGATVVAPARTVVDLPPMLPGDVVGRCVVVETPGAPFDVAVSGESSGELARHLDLVLRHGGPDSTCGTPAAWSPVYDGPVSGFESAVLDLARRDDVPTSSSVAVWIAVSLDADAPDAAQGTGATLQLAWKEAATTS